VTFLSVLFLLLFSLSCEDKKGPEETETKKKVALNVGKIQNKKPHKIYVRRESGKGRFSEKQKQHKGRAECPGRNEWSE
jgi:hypothetical protein